ncbi:MAG: two-component system, OmpR family, sensor histidine kinase TorS [Azoarcus sp.]|uniref:Virulence sensor protein BvgS n=1 Tax=Aromatoleum tolulyticum TaxID=34027 RepID=A0A1N6ZQ67_9RHOO|nr:TMAO reductase system sensor histidine kinase/response regulator TorS [Aromatoleum tolulyticum]MCK9985784.1 two-component system, OmpR family, sensor histidine kinase TorS [Azoarcus sp.]SIR29032.1 two-component system, OmpR family, sensor histidine kinase TorS [Aromatoleum tolulyticum]
MKAWIARLDARLGLIGKLVVVLGAAALLTFTVATIAWLSFQQVVATQRAIIDDAVPAMDAVQAVARLNMRVGAVVERLGRAESPEEVDRLQQAAGEQLAELRGLLQRLEQRHFEPGLGTAIASTLDAIAANLGRQADDVRRRLALARREQELFAGQQQAVLALVMLSESLAANASTATTATISSLYPLIERNPPRERVFESLDRLVEVNFDRMERMGEFQLACFNLKTLLERLEREDAPDALATLQAGFDGNLDILRRRLDDIIDPGRKASGVAHFAILETATQADGLFATRGQRLDLVRSFMQLRDDGAAQAAQLAEQAGALVVAAHRAIDVAGDQSKRAVERGIIGFLAVGALLFFALMATLWVLFRYHVLGRLQGMETTVRALASGDYDVRIATRANDPLAPLARALEQFRDNARERVRLEGELLRHQHELEDQVAARTAELQQSNALLEREVAEHAVARREAEEANRAKSVFLATLSHELRTPLSGVSGSVHLLRDTGLDARQQEYVRMIGYANATLLEILEDMLSFSRLEAGKLDFEHLPFALRDTIDNMLALQGVAARAKGIALVRDIASDVPDILVGDRRKLNQILLNVIGNAIKFTDEGSVTVSVRADPAAAGGTARLHFTVTDTGIGIPPEQCAEVFKPFVQVEDARHHRPGGTGLGLAICQRLVELMGGHIGLESAPGQGTQVGFDIAFELADALPQQAADTRPDAAQRPLDVLLVEDDEINRIVCVRYLESLGHHPLVAGDGEEAIALLGQRHAPIDAVLMDISLPGASGVEVARDLRALDGGRWAAVPVIAMSAHVSADAVERYVGAGMAGFLSKPFDRAQLARALAAATAGGPDESLRARETGACESGEPVLDEDYLAGELDSLGAATLTRLLKLFRADADTALIELGDHLAANDRQALGKRAHRLRSAAGNLGFLRVMAATRRLENAATDPATDGTALAPMIDGLREDCRQACAVLEDWLAAQGEGSAG